MYAGGNVKPANKKTDRVDRRVGPNMASITASVVSISTSTQTQPTEKALSLVHACAVLADIFGGVIDPSHIVGRVQPLPGVRFVGMNDRARRDVLTNQRHCVALPRHDERQGAAHDFARNNHDLAFSCLFLGQDVRLNCLRQPLQRHSGRQA